MIPTDHIVGTYGSIMRMREAIPHPRSKHEKTALRSEGGGVNRASETTSVTIILAGSACSKPVQSWENALCFRGICAEIAFFAAACSKRIQIRTWITAIQINQSINQNIPDALDDLWWGILEFRWPARGIVLVERAHIIAFINAARNRDTTVRIRNKWRILRG